MQVEDSISIIFTAPEEIVVNLGNDTLICGDFPLLLNATWQNAIQYIWQNGWTAPTLTVNESGFYEVEILDACGEIGTASIQVVFEENELSFDLNDTTICIADLPFLLDISNPLINNYEWQDGSTESSFLIPDEGTYSVTVSNQCDTAFSEINIELEDCLICEFYIPNAFSPYPGGGNPTFRPCLLYTSPSPRDATLSRMPSSA